MVYMVPEINTTNTSERKQLKINGALAFSTIVTNLRFTKSPFKLASMVKKKNYSPDWYCPQNCEKGNVVISRMCQNMRFVILFLQTYRGEIPFLSEADLMYLISFCST